MTTKYALLQLGWTPFFQQQLSLQEWEDSVPARVSAQHRSELELLTEQGKRRLALTPSLPDLTVGDWLLLDKGGHFSRQLDRLSLFTRKAPGNKVALQTIAVNIDTVFIVSSLNDDFNLNRIERYLVLAKGAGAEAVIVLTKADHCVDPETYVDRVQALDQLLMVEAVNALDTDSVQVLQQWCRPGNTVALLGSSGVGKSTIVNALLGQSQQDTASIRESDSKGRHTTTARSMHLLPTGGILVDTPGMRELQLADCERGVEETFEDIRSLAEQCRFSDCRHDSEPGCAVLRAVEQGVLEERRLTSYNKLLREQAFNGATVAEKRARERDLHKFYRSVQSHSRRLKTGDE